jgi:NagD protein
MSKEESPHATKTPTYDAYIFDLDGTVYLGDALLPGAKDTITRLRQTGKRTVFLSNNPTRTRHDYAEKLTRLGIETAASDIINSSAVMVHFLQQQHPDGRLFVIGEGSLEDELRQAGFELTENTADIDIVIASFDRTFTYHKLQVGFDALTRTPPARFFATNADKYCPVPGGGQPDAAAIIAALEASTDVKCEAVVGKPSAYMAQAVLDHLQLPPDRCLMTGDRLETDILLGLNTGMATALVLTGATSMEDVQVSEIRPTYILPSLADLP